MAGEHLSNLCWHRGGYRSTNAFERATLAALRPEVGALALGSGAFEALVTELGLTFTFTLILAQPPSFRAKRLTKKAKSINHESLHGRIRLL